MVGQESSIFYNAPKHRVLGIMQMIFGTLLILADLAVMVIAFSKGYTMKQHYEALWCGVPTLLAGAFAYQGQAKNNKCLLIASMIFAIINSIVYFSSMIVAGTMVSAFGIIMSINTQPMMQSVALLGFAIMLVWLIISLIMFPVSICQAAFCCGDTCPGCCCYHPPNEAGVGGAPDGHQMA